MKRPIETRRKKHFRGSGLWGFGTAARVGWDESMDADCEEDAACDLSGVDSREGALSACLSGGGIFLTGTMGVCFL